MAGETTGHLRDHMARNTQGEAQSDVRGTCEAPLAGWEDLCYDVKQLILGKLSLRDLARAAPTCKHFKTTCVSRATEERAALTATAVEAYGEDVFSGFAMAVQRVMRGLSPCPSLDCNENIPKGDILISSPAGPRYASRKEIVDGVKSGEPFGVIFDHTLLRREFQGSVRPRQTSPNGKSPGASWSLYKVGDNILQLKVGLHISAAAQSLGLLLAICSERLEALPEISQSLLMIQFSVRGQWSGAALRKAADPLVAPLRSLARSVTISWQTAEPFSFSNNQKV